jgi:mono/diheme cytochrome c family protein
MNRNKFKTRYILFLIFLFNITYSEAENSSKLAGDLPQVNNESKNIVRGPILKPGPDGKEQIGDLKGDLSNGEKIFVKYCVYCHGTKGLGEGLAAMTLKPSPANFIERNSYKKSDQTLFETVTYGFRASYQLEMPAWGPVLSKQERADVISYVKKISKRKD